MRASARAREAARPQEPSSPKAIEEIKFKTVKPVQSQLFTLFSFSGKSRCFLNLHLSWQCLFGLQSAQGSVVIWANAVDIGCYFPDVFLFLILKFTTLTALFRTHCVGLLFLSSLDLSVQHKTLASGNLLPKHLPCGLPAHTTEERPTGLSVGIARTLYRLPNGRGFLKFKKQTSAQKKKDSKFTP